jgi:hypothetical protein
MLHSHGSFRSAKYVVLPIIDEYIKVRSPVADSRPPSARW